tara:strand:+ start:15940 stop:16611 length:672 start_codon:yes stop_codon:yes gene_type:complete
MIQINLLPDEYRKSARTPLKFVAAIAAATAINGSLVAVWTWMVFGVAAKLETEQTQLQMEMDGLTPQVAYHDALDEEITIFATREETLVTINKNRVLWTEKLDQLLDVVNSGNQVDHFIWFDDLSVKQEAPRRGSTTFGELKANGHSGSDKWNQVANFLEDIEDTELSGFIRDFAAPGMPQGTQNSPDPDLIPAVNWSFPLTLGLRSPDERSAVQQPNVEAGR